MKTIIPIFLILSCFALTARAQKTKIAVGLAYKEKTEQGCSLFKDAVGYRYLITQDQNTTLGNLRSQISGELSQKYDIKPSNVLVTTSDRFTNFYIIEYHKKITAYPCVKKSYAVGMGNSQKEAENAAVKEKNLYCPECDYTYVVSN